MSAIKTALLALSAVALVEADSKEVKLVAAVNSLIEKAAEAGVKLEVFRAERVAAELAAKVEVNDTVAFVFGRGETKKELEGKVLAVVETPTGKLLKVLAGEGADMKVFDVLAKFATVKGAEALTQDPIVDAPAETVAEPVVETAPAGGEAVDVDALIGAL